MGKVLAPLKSIGKFIIISSKLDLCANFFFSPIYNALAKNYQNLKIGNAVQLYNELNMEHSWTILIYSY